MWSTSVHLILLKIITICVLFVAGDKYRYKINTFKVPLDHFSFVSNQTFDIRYLTNDSFTKDDRNNPIFFYTGNEGDIELFAQNTGFMWDIAKEFNALLVFAEHRYYGKSMPFGNKSLTSPEYSGYLASEQALADFADLLANQINTKRRPVIAFGGSYGGMLAAWFRIKYPHLVTGAIASSAPILQFTSDCNRFNTILTSVYSAGQENCAKNIRDSWNVIKKQAATPEGRNNLNSKFKLCTNLTKPEDQDELVEYLSDVYGNLAMVNYPYKSEFLAPLPANPVIEFCTRLNESYNKDDTLLDALQNALSIYSNYTGQIKCLDIKSAFDPSFGDLGWDYQSCTEMVMPMCSKPDDKKNMFPPKEWDFQKVSDKCYEKFKVRPNQNMATTIYGGKHLKYASNIVFSNGLLDPWSGGGVLRSPNDQITIIIIPDAAHHLDLRGSNPNDPPSILEARATEKRTIHNWLSSDSDFY